MNFSLHAPSKKNKLILLTFFIGMALVPASVYADEVQSWMTSLTPTVSLRSGVFEQSKDEREDHPVYPQSLWLSLKPDSIWDVQSFIEASTRLDSLGQRAQTEVREGYLERSFGPLDLRVGRQVIVWGRADKLNPTDYLSTKDLRRLSSDDEDQRLGIGSAQFSLNVANSRLIAVWQYEWRRPLFPVFHPNRGVTLTHSDPTHADQQYALKWDHTGERVDWSISGFSGYNRSPDFKIRELGSEGFHLELVHHRIRALGGDVAFNALDIGWRGEWSHLQTVDHGAHDPLTQNDSTEAVWGGDRNIAENLNLNVQGFTKWVKRDQLTAELDPVVLLLQSQLKTNSRQRRAYQDGLTLRLNYKLWQETLELETAVVWNRQEGDRTARPKVTYAWTDRLKTILGAEIYRGPKDSFFGQLEPMSSSYAEIRYGF